MAGNDLVSEVEQFVKAGFTALWVQSHEHEEAIKQLIELCGKRKWEIGYWDADQGLKGSDKIAQQRTADEMKKEPAWYDKKALKLVQDMEKIATKTKAQRTIFVLKNLHRREYMENSALLQAVLNSIAVGKAAEFGWCLVVMAPTISIPVEWDNDFVVVNHELPNREQLWEIAQGIAQKNELPKDDNGKQMVLDAATGMTRRAAEGAFSLSIVRKKPFDPEIVQSLKAQAIKRRNLMTLYEGDDTFDKMGGIDQFKAYCEKILGKRRTNPLLYPKGLLLLGVPGSGKSQAVKCLGNATNRPVLSLDVGQLRSKFQGETDQNTRDALRIADSINWSPSTVMCW